MSLPQAEREVFLAEPRIGSVAVNRPDPGRAPLLVPVWYVYEPGGELWVLTGRDSAKAKAIEAAGRFSLLAERVEPTVRYVSVEGPVLSVETGTAAHLEEVSYRYLPRDSAAAYVKTATEWNEPMVKIRMRPEKWLSADLGAF